MARSLQTSWYRQQQARLAYRKGLSCARRASHEGAVAAFTQALEVGHPRPESVQIMRGLSRIELKDNEGAIADFDAIISTVSESADAQATPNFALAQAHHHRGLLRQQVGNEAGALVDWSEAVVYWPHYSEPHYQRSLVFLGQGHHDKALADLNAALIGNPTMSNAYLQRGNLRYQLGDIPGAVGDWELAICNDFTLEAAKQKLETVQQAAYDARLSAILKAPLAAKGLTAEVNHSGSQLDIHIHRELGTGVNYYTLPELIREHLVPLHLADVKKFQLIGHLAEVHRLEWNQSYDLYKGQPCPPSNWQTAFSTLVMFPPFGIPAFIQAAQVKRFYKKGEYLEALSASKSIKGLCVAGSITLGFFTLLPLGYAAYDSMQEQPTFNVAEKIEENKVHRPYHQIRRDNTGIN